MKPRQLITGIMLIAVIITAGILMGNLLMRYIASAGVKAGNPTTSTTVRFVSSTITADGAVTAQNQAKLNFQTGGKLIYLPHKEGDHVNQGQTIAQLDTYQLKRSLTAALNTYRSTRDTFDQTQQNSQNGVLKPQLTQNFSNATYPNDNAVNDAIKRIVDQNQASLDNSVINVELSNYALQLSTLTSPLQGIITHEDVTVAGINITPLTSFTVADPESMVFRANVPAENIYYVNADNQVTIAVDGIPQKLSGTVVKIYPSKVTLPSGVAVYQVDIQSDDLKKLGQLDQAGTAIISTHAENVALVPAWTVLNGKYIWVENQGHPELKLVTTGKTHDNEIEITQGLTATDKIIISPKYISSLSYQLP